MDKPIPEAVRDAFEAWASGRGMNMRRTQFGQYFDGTTNCAWLAWQAALTAAQQQGQAVAKVELNAFSLGGLVYTEVGRNANLRDGTLLYTASALAQQPAAVDGAKVSAAFSRLERNAYGDPRTAAANRSRDIRTIREALATQHQEPTTCSDDAAGGGS